MSATTVLTREVPSAPTVRIEAPQRPRRSSARVRGVRRAGRPLGPVDRSTTRQLPALAPANRRVRGCWTEEPGVPSEAVTPSGQLRLTERGIALILVAGLMVVIAATTVVGLTAIRVTGDGSTPLPSSYSALPLPQAEP